MNTRRPEWAVADKRSVSLKRSAPVGCQPVHEHAEADASGYADGARWLVHTDELRCGILRVQGPVGLLQPLRPAAGDLAH